jgi:hypothetical protein
MDNRIDGVVLSVMNEMSSFSGKPGEVQEMGLGRAPEGKAKQERKVSRGPRRK